MRAVTDHRAGYGWSDPGTANQTGDDVVADLHALLANARLTPPYVLVGHSLVGLYVRSFTARYPDEAAGLVLVDSSHEQMLDRIRDGSATRPSRGARHDPRGEAWHRAASPASACKRPAGRAAARKPSAASLTMSSHPHRAVPAVVVAPSQIAQMRGMRDTMRVRSRECTSGRAATRGRRRPPSRRLTTHQCSRAIRPLWSELQDDLASRSTRSLHLTATQGGHFVHHDDPDTVLEAIRWVLAEASPLA